MMSRYVLRLRGVIPVMIRYVLRRYALRLLHLAPLHLAPLHLAPLHLAPLHLAPGGGNSHDEQVRFTPEGGKPVERFGELDLGLVQSLRDPTGLGRWWVVTHRSASSDHRRLHSGPVVPGL